MGIRGLWNAVSAASQKRTLMEIAVSEGFDQQRRQDRCLILGIDASIWMNQAQKAVGRGTGTRAGENSAVRVLFYRLCRLLTLPIIPVFVFDGPDRPSKKRGKQALSAKARKKLHWLSTPFQKFIDAFGFAWYTAPGEAEADLAALSSRNNIDAILSEDSDSLLNNARCIFRMKNVKDDKVEVFTADAIKSHPQVSLDRDGLFLMAILCGSDYHKTGLSGCGWKTARQIACGTDLAHSLFTATLSLPTGAALQNFLCEWRQSLRTLLLEDPDHILGKKLPSLASKINRSFPSVDVLLQYAKPLTSWTAAGCEPPDASSWKLRQPCLDIIGTLCEKYFSWGSLHEIVARLRGNLWPGIAARHLLQPPNIMAYGDDIAAPEDRRTNIHTVGILAAEISPAYIYGYTVIVSTRNILLDCIAGLDGPAQLHAMESAKPCSKVSVWIPSSVLTAALPELVYRFECERYASENDCDRDSDDTSDDDLADSPMPSAYQPVLPALHQIPDMSKRSHEPTPPIAPFAEAAVESDIIDLCSPRPSEFVQGSSTRGGPGHLVPNFLGFVDLCTPSPLPKSPN